MKMFQAEVWVISINSDKFSGFAVGSTDALKWLVNYKKVLKKIMQQTLRFKEVYSDH
jgi:hypothetical protein